MANSPLRRLRGHERTSQNFSGNFISIHCRCEPPKFPIVSLFKLVHKLPSLDLNREPTRTESCRLHPFLLARIQFAKIYTLSDISCCVPFFVRVGEEKFFVFLHLFHSLRLRRSPGSPDGIKNNNQHSCKMNDGKYMQTFYER